MEKVKENIAVYNDAVTEKNNAEFFSIEQTDCPLCAKHRNPKTGELCFNVDTLAGIKEVDDMLAGKIPNTLKSFNSLEEMLSDLDSDD